MAFKNKFADFENITVNNDLFLRQVDVEKDLESYFNIYKNYSAFKYYEGASENITREKVSVILLNQIKAFEKAREYVWTITDKNDKPLGRIHLSNFEANNKIANIGYFLGEKSWKKGIISACILPVIQFGFSYLGLERIYATVHVDNIASWKALEKNGFMREGLLRHSFNISSGLSDCYLYSKLFTD